MSVRSAVDPIRPSPPPIPTTIDHRSSPTSKKQGHIALSFRTPRLILILDAAPNLSRRGSGHTHHQRVGTTSALRTGRGISGSHLSGSREPRTQRAVGKTNSAEYPHSGVAPEHPGPHNARSLRHTGGGLPKRRDCMYFQRLEPSIAFLYLILR